MPPDAHAQNGIAQICERLQLLRIRVCGERGQSHFAHLLGLSPSTYNYYEKGRVPPVSVLDRASRITRAPLLWLIRGDPTDFNLSSVPTGCGEHKGRSANEAPPIEFPA